ncbi:MAG: class I SAM-dependent methyltransferase [Desulfomonilaceae bacterium]
MKERTYSSLQDVARYGDIAIYNTEADKAIHKILRNHPKYVCSEYFGPGVKSGAYIHGIMHEDLMTLSLESECIDLVISSDVFEHIPDPYKAHEQVYRVLKKGGRHIFTVPFYQNEYVDEVRASLGSHGDLTYHKEPIYHGDPLREEGALVFTIFSLEMLVRLAKIGFRTQMWKLRDPDSGILGGNAIVFEACKD